MTEHNHFDPLDPFGISAPRSVEHEAAELQPMPNWDDEPAAAGSATVLEHALALAARGFRILPLQPGDKIPPKGLRWKDEAATDPTTIRTWFAVQPNANYGVAAGDGLLVLDVDGEAGRGRAPCAVTSRRAAAGRPCAV